MTTPMLETFGRMTFPLYYTLTLPHTDLKKKMKWLVVKAFDMIKGKRFMWLNTIPQPLGHYIRPYTRYTHYTHYTHYMHTCLALVVVTGVVVGVAVIRSVEVGVELGVVVE